MNTLRAILLLLVVTLAGCAAQHEWGWRWYAGNEDYAPGWYYDLKRCPKTWVPWPGKLCKCRDPSEEQGE